MATISQQLYQMWTFAMSKSLFWKRDNYSVQYCIQQCHKCLMCWNNIPWTLTVHERACSMDPQNVNVRLEGQHVTECWTSATSALISIGGEHIPRAKSDLWCDIGAICYSTVKDVCHKASPSPKIFKTHLCLDQWRFTLAKRNFKLMQNSNAVSWIGYSHY
jgi:hypothetical protein